MNLHRRILVSTLLGLLLVGAGAGSALGASLTIPPSYAPVARIPHLFTVDVQLDGAGTVYVENTPSRVTPCGPTPESDNGNATLSAAVNGPATPSVVLRYALSGQHLFCGWVRDSTGKIVATLSQSVDVAKPSGSLALAIPPLAPFNRPFVITFSGQTQVGRSLFATIRPAGGAPCAPTPRSDSGSSLVYGTSVDGAFNVPIEAKLDTRGTFLICAWLADDSGDLDAIAKLEQTITNVPLVIPSPAPVVSSVKWSGRKLRTTVGLSAGGRIVLRLVGKGRRIGIGAVTASGPRTVVISYTRPRNLVRGRYTLEATFRAKGATTSSVRRRAVVVR